ncbi:MAG: ABC transporter ATP-binding protein [Candidatus Brocadiaceae bacterium]|nr:ABC transporter ATP-binding protein [Candidatus Brocadiaceae bacterium]
MKIVLESFCKSFGKEHVIEDMNLEVLEGEMLALLGPSGCGKTTTLFAICGIHHVTSGRILFGETVMNEVPAQKRNVGVVFQSYSLYPHLSVYENIAFPLRMKKDGKQTIDGRVREYAKKVQIENLLERKPAQLSGGQQQRVALARALIRYPSVLLMDEPLANLDAKLRLEMRSEIRAIQQNAGITSILVTHDQVEAMSMCDRIAIMNEGKIQQICTPQNMYREPQNIFVADFIGNPPICFYDGVIKNSCFVGSALAFALNGAHLKKDTQPGQRVKIGIRPEFFQPEDGNFVEGAISFVETQGRETLYDVRLADGNILRSIQRGESHYQLGDHVKWGFPVEKIYFFDEQGNRL